MTESSYKLIRILNWAQFSSWLWSTTLGPIAQSTSTVNETVSRSSTLSLQNTIDKIYELTDRNNMRLNVKKRRSSGSLSFTRSPLTLNNLSSADTEIDVVDHFKFLGVTISSNLTWTIKRRQMQCQKLYRNILVQKKHKLGSLLPEPKQYKYSQQVQETSTNWNVEQRAFKSFIPSCVNKWDNMRLWLDIFR